VIHTPTTARRAGFVIAGVTIAVAIAGAVVMRVVDREEQFDSIGVSLWWSLQTITTVGYGDTVPQDTLGRAVAAVVMVTGIAFVAVITAAISAAFVESARRRMGRNPDDVIIERLDRIEAALATLTQAQHERVADQHAQPDADERLDRVDDVVEPGVRVRPDELGDADQPDRTRDQ
jgi:voltage-gated potassium channel Kch